MGLLKLLSRSQPERRIGLLLAGDEALHVDAPGGELRLEGNGLEGDAQLGAPAAGVDAGGGVPDAVPVQAGLPSRGQPFGAGAPRVDREEVGGALVQERVEQDPQHVVVVAAAAAPAIAVLVAAAAAVVGHGVGGDLLQALRPGRGRRYRGWRRHRGSAARSSRSGSPSGWGSAMRKAVNATADLPDRIGEVAVDFGTLVDAHGLHLGRGRGQGQEHAKTPGKKTRIWPLANLVAVGGRREQKRPLEIVNRRRLFCKIKTVLRRTGRRRLSPGRSPCFLTTTGEMHIVHP